MIRRHTAAIHVALMSIDALTSMALCVLVANVVATVWLGGVDWRLLWHRTGIDPVVAAALYASAWVGILWMQNLYRLRARVSFRRELADITRSILFMAIGTFAALFIVKLPEVSRAFLLVLFAAQLVLTITSRMGLRWLLAELRATGRNGRFLLIIGTGPVARELSARLERRLEMGLHVMGYLAVPGEAVRPGLARPVLGSVDDLEQVLHQHVVDEIGVCLPVESLELTEPLTRLAEEEGKIVRIPRPPAGLVATGGRLESFEGIPLLSLVYGPDRAIMLMLKRVADIAVAGVSLVLLGPLFAAVGLAILAIDGRPVFFHQTRVGLHGRPFRIVKFRTMVPDAEARLADVLDRNELTGPVFKVTDDPRTTRTGRWLRRASLDEFPQLWNVLRGDMSLVGPRPPLPREVAGYDLWQRRRLSMKPGMTGLWQVSARRDADFDRWVRLDLDYIDRWSPWLDVKIMARTIPALLQGR